MKARAERMAERAIETFVKAMQRQITDTLEAMNCSGETHSDEEISASRQYQMLVEAHYGAMMLLRRVTEPDLDNREAAII